MGAMMVVERGQDGGSGCGRMWTAVRIGVVMNVEWVARMWMRWRNGVVEEDECMDERKNGMNGSTKAINVGEKER